MQFQYTIVPQIGGTDQVGMLLKCVSELQAQEIHRALRQYFKVSRLMPPKYDTGYTNFVYVTASEAQLREKMPEIEALCSPKSGQISADRAAREGKVAQDFKTWQAQFRNVLKQLSADSPSPTSLVQEFSLERLEQQITAGRTTEVEERLLRQIPLNGKNNLRALIALYARTDRNDRVVELCETKRSEVLALPVSGRLAEQIVSAYLQRYEQNQSPDLLRAAQQLAQEFLPELERLRQADGVRRLLHQALTPQEPLPLGTGATLSEQLVQLIEIEPAERIPQLESLREKYPGAVSVLMALAASHAALGNTENTERALQLYGSVPVKTEAQRQEVQQRCAELLLKTGRFTEVIDLLPDSQDISPALAGLRGAALYHLKEESQALQFLEKAWHGGERKREMLLPLARLWTNQDKFEPAAEAYEILQETASEYLISDDRLNIAAITYRGGFGDISDEQVLREHDQWLNRQESDADW